MIYCLILLANIFFNINSWVFDFAEGKTGEEWMIVNDGVMGGLSRGKVEFSASTVIFSGDVSLENNGGFTSFRSPYGLYDLSEYDKVEIKYRLEGLNCALSFDQNRRFWRPNHKLPLTSTDNIWMTLEANLYELSQYQMGRETGRRMSPYHAKNTIRLGIITDSKKEGSFRLEIDYIKFFKAEE